jgi:hypothetical protein
MKRYRKIENDADGAGFNDETKGLIIVDVVFLGDAANDPSGFVTRKRTVGVIFVVKYPLATNDVGAGRFGNQVPGTNFQQGVVLIAHSSRPVGRLREIDDRFAEVEKGEGEQTD